MRVPTLVLAVVAISQMGATDCGQALRDPGFDVWCGDQLCAWKVERGEVARVPTWNEGDPGVALVGNDVAIEQLSPVDSGDGTCLEFDMIANVETDAQVTLGIDVFGDGSVEYTETIPTSSWAPLTFKLPIRGPYRGVRFELAKRGNGRAVLAQIGAKLIDDCAALPPIIPAAAPLGSPCADSTGCAMGTCEPTFFGGLCMACTDGSCPANQTCGPGAPTSPVRELPRACEPDASRVLGEQCLHDAECASGICNFGYEQPTLEPGGEYGNCSACRPGGTACPTAATCGAAWPTAGLHAPFVCAPGLATAAAGAACATDGDCASGTCTGTSRTQCEVDGRACATAADCPFDGLKNTACSTVGVQGGSCQ
jgi:hypothetical protein